MRTPTHDDTALLTAARQRFPKFTAETHQACHWLLETTHPANAEAWLANLELALPAVSELFAHETIPHAEQLEWVFPVSAVLGEYLTQRFGGTWVIDEEPTSHSFGRPVLEVKKNGREMYRFDVMGRSAEFLALPAPRDFFASVVTPMHDELAK